MAATFVKFDDSRIKHHHDKKLLYNIRNYFKIFTGGDFEGMKNLQTEDYTMTDIPLGVVKANRDTWFGINKNFVGLMDELEVVALTLYGSSAPGHFSILEHAVKFRLTTNPPPEAAHNLPEGAKLGDTVGMINLCVLWWTEDGKIAREFEYGRLTWKDFDLDAWDKGGFSKDKPSRRFATSAKL